MPDLRLPTSFQWLTWAAKVNGVEHQSFVGRCDHLALEGALDRVRSMPLHGDQRVDTARALATVLSWFSATSPFPPHRRKMSVQTAELVASMSGYELMLREPQRAPLGDGINPSSGGAFETIDECAAWLRPRLREMSRAEAAVARQKIDSLIGAKGTERPRIVISRPASLLDEGESNRLDHVVGEIRKVCINEVGRFIAKAGGSDAFDPVLGPVCIEAPATDRRYEDDPRESCELNLPILLRANALVILGWDGGSHTTGYEHALVASSAPVLYVAWGDVMLPAAISGGLSPSRVDVKRAVADEAVPAIVAAFLRRRWQAIVRSWHISEGRELIYGPLARAIEAKLKDVERPRLHRLLESWGLQAGSLSRLTTSDGLAATSAETIQTIVAALGLSVNLPHQRPAPMRLSQKQLDALTQFQHEYEIPPSEIGVLRRAAEHQMQTGVMRLSLGSMGDWREFRRQVKEAGWL